MALKQSFAPGPIARVASGADNLDAVLGGGFVLGALHEVYAASEADGAAAFGFMVALATRAAGSHPIVLIRDEFLDAETGCLSASGLRDMGLDVARLILVRAPSTKETLRAAEQALRCASLGGVILEVWSKDAGIRDCLTPTRRLSLAAAQSGIPVFLVHRAAAVSPSAAATRWRLAARPSRALDANAPGLPMFEASLLRQRAGAAGRAWCVEWNRDDKRFEERRREDFKPLRAAVAPLPRTVLSLPADRQVEARPQAAGQGRGQRQHSA